MIKWRFSENAILKSAIVKSTIVKNAIAKENIAINVPYTFAIALFVLTMAFKIVPWSFL